MKTKFALTSMAVLGLAQFAGAQIYTQNGNVAITDLTPGVTMDLVIADNGLISDVNVGLIITHTWQGDIIASLEHVGFGGPVALINRPGGTGAAVGFSADNYGDLNANNYYVLDDEAASIYDTPFVASPGITNATGSWQAGGPLEAPGGLAAFDGQNISGTWRLRVSDHAAGDVGAIRSLQLRFTLVPAPSALALLGLGGLAGMGRRRRA